MLNFMMSEADIRKYYERRRDMINTFDYRKLKGRIVEKYGTQSAFFAKVGITKNAGSLKMQQKTGLSQDDIVRWCKLLDIDLKDIGPFFYTLKV